MNLATISLFALDKQQAVSGGWRVRESTLLAMAFWGGSIGALWARRHYRHKTRKQPFASALLAILIAQLVLALFWLNQA